MLLAAWLLPRPLLALAGDRLSPLTGRQAFILLALARAGIVVLTVVALTGQLELLALGALLFGVLSAWAGASRATALRRLFGGSAISAAGSLDVIVGRLALALGAALAAVLLLIAPAAAAWLAAVLLAAAWLVLFALIGWERRTVPGRRAFAASGGASDESPGPSANAGDRAAPGESAAAASTPPAEPSTRFRPLDQPRGPTILAASFGVGMLFGGLLAVLPELATLTAGAPALAGVALSLVGVGALLLQLPIGRLRLHLPPVFLPTLLVLVIALAVVAVAVSGTPLVGLPLLFLVGSGAAALDAELLVRLRRLADNASLSRGLVVAVGAGQLVGALTVALIGAEVAEIGGPLTLLAIGAVALQAIALIVDRQAIAGARHQVQQFSWDADPPPRPAEPHRAGTRPARLAGWISRHVEIELVDVTLPQSGRRYAVARPSGDGRDSLFEAAKRDPERQMPFWAKVWPSGVALADVVVERAAEVRGRQVLELGAGLGVTACSVLEEGGELVTADYSLLPLALCRLNGIANTGRAPGSICFNWRDEEQIRQVLRRHPPIGLILAADVLYEGRDVLPLIGVLDRLLAVNGSLWLAEPVRKTAQRFLDTVAALGWQVESRTIHANWPDATSGRVNVHVIRREDKPIEAVLGLGGWQI